MLRFKWRQQQQKAPRDEPTVNDGSSSVNQKLAVTNFFFADMWQQKKRNHSTRVGVDHIQVDMVRCLSAGALTVRF